MQTKKILTIAGIAVLPLFLLLLSYQLTLAFSSLTPAQEEIFQFLDGKGELNQDYTAAEVSHLEDVAKVMKGAPFFLYASEIIIFMVLLYLRKDKEQLQKVLRYGGVATVAFIAVILLAIFIGFEGVFTLFHLIFFPQGNWQFAADSLLIRTFPPEFFVGISIFILGLAILSGLAVFLLSVHIKNKYPEA